MTKYIPKIRLTKTRLAIIVLLICIAGSFFIRSDNRSPEAILKQIEDLRQQGHNLKDIERQLGSPHQLSSSSSCGTSPPRLRHCRSSTWFFVRNANPLNCEICMITVYAMGDGEIVDVDMQTEVVLGLSAWKCIWYRATGEVGNAYSLVTMQTKSPL